MNKPDKRALFFFLHNPCPPITGGHKRVLELIKAFKINGYEIGFVSSTIWTDNPWTKESISTFKKDYVDELFLHTPSKEDLEYREDCKKKNKPRPLTDFFHAPPGLRRYFDSAMEEFNPSHFCMTYLFSETIFNHEKYPHVKTLIDTHAIFSLESGIDKILRPYFGEPVKDVNDINDNFLDLNFTKNLDLKPDPEEFKVYNDYDFTIAIAEEEFDILQKEVRNSHNIFAPMTHPVLEVENSYDGHAILPIGFNPPNIQGYYYFVKHILPKVLEECPDFCLDVTGSWSEKLLSFEGIELKGFLTSLDDYYCHAPFLPCPIFSGGGQQVKIVEAMAHAVPVISFHSSGLKSPIIHGVNGLLAESPEEFAKHCILLWKDRNLCKKLGTAAQEIIATEYSSKKFAERLSPIFSNSIISNNV